MRLAVVTCLVLLARPAWAQTTSTPNSTPTPPTTEGLGLDLTETKDTAKKDAPLATPGAGGEAVFDERQLTEEDRVKAIQRKVYVRSHRFELMPAVFVTANDPFFSKYGVSLRGSYFLADTLAVGAHGSWYRLISTDDVTTAKRDFQAQIFNSKPTWSLLGDVEWSPIYGKATIFNTILHFDAYVLGGAGVVWTETSSTPLDSNKPSGPTRGPALAGEVGFGLRFMALDFFAINVALIDTSYVDTPAGTRKGALQNLLTLQAGISVFFPFRSTGRESE